MTLSGYFPATNRRRPIELGRSGLAHADGLALPVDGLGSLAVSLYAEGTGTCGAAGGARGVLLPRRPRAGRSPGPTIGSWRSCGRGASNGAERGAEVAMPAGAARAVFQIEKSDTLGKIRIDDV